MSCTVRLMVGPFEQELKKKMDRVSPDRHQPSKRHDWAFTQSFSRAGISLRVPAKRGRPLAQAGAPAPPSQNWSEHRSKLVALSPRLRWGLLCTNNLEVAQLRPNPLLGRRSEKSKSSTQKYCVEIYFLSYRHKIPARPNVFLEWCFFSFYRTRNVP